MKTQTLISIMRKSTNKKRILVSGLIFTLAAVISVVYITVINPMFAQAFVGQGTGTQNDPYQIDNCAQLQSIKEKTTSSYVLVSDVDCSDTINWNAGSGFEPIPSFSGDLDGRNFKISGLYINRPTTYWVGLFQIIDGGMVENLTFQRSGEQEFDMLGGNNIGSLAAEIWEDSIIKNIHSDLHLTTRDVYNAEQSNAAVGGLAGIVRSSIQQSSFTGSVTGLAKAFQTAQIGGIAGTVDSQPVAIIDSYSDVQVSFNMSGAPDTFSGDCGGFAGNMSAGSAIQTSYSKGTINCQDRRARSGGLIGTANPANVSIDRSFSLASVHAFQRRVGSIGVGALIGSMSGTETIENSAFVAPKTGFGEPGSGNGQFSGPSRMDTDSQGNIYVADADNYRVQKFDKDGNFLTSWSGGPYYGWQLTDKPIDIYVDKADQDTVYVLVSSGGLMTRYAPDCEPRDFYPVLWGNRGFTIDQQGRFVIAGGGSILVVSKQGEILQNLTSGFGEADGHLRNVTDVAFRSDGKLVVSDTGNKRIQIFDYPVEAEPNSQGLTPLTLVAAYGEATNQQII